MLVIEVSRLEPYATGILLIGISSLMFLVDKQKDDLAQRVLHECRAGVVSAELCYQAHEALEED